MTSLTFPFLGFSLYGVGIVSMTVSYITNNFSYGIYGIVAFILGCIFLAVYFEVGNDD